MKINKMIKHIILHIWAYSREFFIAKYENDMLRMQELNVFETHQKTFGKYKNYYQGKDIAIIATGPSLKKYKPLKDVINIGVNKAFMHENIKLDYIFIQDYLATKSYIEQLAQSGYNNIKKFYGVVSELKFVNFYDSRQLIVPESIINRHKAEKYYLYTRYLKNHKKFNCDIDKCWIQDCYSVAFSAMQFALFTNPKRIYIVGCDCSSGYFDGSKGNNLTALAKTWAELKEFAEIYYPETEIISVNPVGLKGLFKDLYQE